jgi:branched-chain amino acid transport system substrate-binding protein
MVAFKQFHGHGRRAVLLLRHPQEQVNEWLVANHYSKLKAPPDLLHRRRLSAAIASSRRCGRPRVTPHGQAHHGDGRHELRDAQGHDDLPQGGPPAMQDMYHFSIKNDPAFAWGVPELVRVIPASELQIPIRNKR